MCSVFRLLKLPENGAQHVVGLLCHRFLPRPLKNYLSNLLSRAVVYQPLLLFAVVFFLWQMKMAE